MFVVPFPTQKPALPKRKFFRKKEVLAAVIPLRIPHMLPFYGVELPIVNGEPHWGAFLQAAKGCAPRVLSLCPMPFPVDFPIEVWFPREFAARTVLRSAAKLLKRDAAPHKSICVTDPSGAAGEEICRLFPLAGTVRVVTDAPNRFVETARIAMEHYGATLVFSSAPRGDDTVIPVPQSNRQNGVYPICSQGTNAVYGRGFPLPRELDFLPKIADPLTLAGGLYTLCGYRDFAADSFLQTGALGDFAQNT